ncbi:MAG: hypothetical protein AAF318_03510 [Pseudomonadota bacterium]
MDPTSQTAPKNALGLKNTQAFKAEVSARSAPGGAKNIDQTGWTYLCGPAAFLFCVARSKPKLYSAYMDGLLKNGVGSIGNLKITVSEAFKKRQKPAVMADADWYGLGPLREQTGGTAAAAGALVGSRGMQDATFPEQMMDWFRSAGWQSVTGRYKTTANASFQTLVGAQQHHLAGDDVVLLVEGAVVDEQRKDRPCFAEGANHWVVSAGQFTISTVWPSRSWSTALTATSSVYDPYRVCGHQRRGRSPTVGEIMLDVYTWGDIAPSSPYGRQPIERFLSGFYGFVAARPPS